MISPILKRTLVLLTLVFMSGASAYSAGTYPSKVIRIVVPTTPGTPPDVISRIVANELSESNGWKVVIENRGGGLYSVAAFYDLMQEYDRFTLLAISVLL